MGGVTSFRKLAEPLSLVAFCVIAWVLAFDIGDGGANHPLGADSWPKAVLALLTFAVLMNLVAHLRAQATVGDETEPQKPAEKAGPRAFLTLGLIFGFPVFWAVTMHMFGFLPTMPIFLFAFAWMLGFRRPLTLVLICLAMTALVTMVFYRIFFTPLPMGMGAFNAFNGHLLGLIQ